MPPGNILCWLAFPWVTLLMWISKWHIFLLTAKPFGLYWANHNNSYTNNSLHHCISGILDVSSEIPTSHLFNKGTSCTLFHEGRRNTVRSSTDTGETQGQETTWVKTSRCQNTGWHFGFSLHALTFFLYFRSPTAQVAPVLPVEVSGRHPVIVKWWQ